MALSKTTQDHGEIQQWAEKRGAVPAEVTSTHSKNEPGILRFCFPKAPNHNNASLRELPWEEFFQKFDENGLELVYQEVTSEGAESNFNKLIYPTDESHSSRHGKSSTTHASASHSGSGSGSPKSHTTSSSSHKDSGSQSKSTASHNNAGSHSKSAESHSGSSSSGSKSAAAHDSGASSSKPPTGSKSSSSKTPASKSSGRSSGSKSLGSKGTHKAA